MEKLGGPSFSMDNATSSDALQKLVSTISKVAVTILDTQSEKLILRSYGHRVRVPPNSRNDAACLMSRNAHVDRIRKFALSAAELHQLNQSVIETQTVADGLWQAADMQLNDGTTDRIALQLNPDEDFDMTRAFLQRVWPILRQDCIAEITEQRNQESSAAPLPAGWDILNRIDVAMIILDRHSLMYRVNLAAREVLDEGVVLRRGKGGVFAASQSENAEFRKAVAACAEGETNTGDRVVFLSTGQATHRVPLTLSRYVHNGECTKYVVAMMPTPPSTMRVERLVKQMGLTSSEARVAALIQLGLSNREAAELAQLKPQTFNTYAKRVLSKLNVKGRTEMAQMLTWQAAGGRRI